MTRIVTRSAFDLGESINLEMAAPQQSFPLHPAQLVSSPLIGHSSFKVEGIYEHRPADA